MKFNGRSDRTIKPGAVEKLSVTLSSRKYRGSFSKKITVTTNDPLHPRVTLLCKGQVLLPLKVNPRNINFGKVSRKGPSQTKKVVITRGDGGPLQPQLTSDKKPAEIQTKLTEIKPGERYELEVTLTPPFKSERLRTNIKLQTGIAEAPTTTIAVYASIAPRVVPKPTRFTVPKKRDGEWQQSIQLIWEDGKEHRILGATVNDSKLRVEIEDKNGRQQVVLKVSPLYSVGKGGRTVIVKTDDPLQPQVKVPISFTRQRIKQPRHRAFAKPQRPSRESRSARRPKSPTTMPAIAPAPVPTTQPAAAPVRG
ncbi:MAG: hypothetical protein KAV00_05875 [Phycisphaerae bacterium]|nr:hypothetical protein [Phycisphaerae bacterium]